MTNFRRITGNTIFDNKRNEEILEEMKVEPADEKLKRYKSNLLRHVTRMKSNRMPKIMLNYRPNGRRRLGTTFNPLKTNGRLLYLKTQFVPRSKHFSSRL